MTAAIALCWFLPLAASVALHRRDRRRVARFVAQRPISDRYASHRPRGAR